MKQLPGRYKFIFIQALLAAVILTVFIFLTGYTVNLLKLERQERLREQIVQRSSAIQSALTNEINFSANLVLGLIGTVSIYPDLSNEDFLRLAEIINNKSAAIRSISMAPNNIIAYFYPMKGNEHMIGFDYMKAPKHRKEVQKAVQLPNGLLSGPLSTEDGHEVFITRVPIYIGKGGYEYWGMASIELDKEKLLSKANIGASNYWLRIAVKGRDGLGLDGDVFIGDEEIFSMNPVLTTIKLPEGLWVMAAVPVKGWEIKTNRWDYIVWLTGILIGAIVCAFILNLQSAHRKMKELALRDPLTGLANRRLFDILVERQLIMAERGRYSLHMLYIDLDNFKKVNDIHGHKTGDLVLQHFAKSVLANTRKTDILARIGGDEFVMLPCRMTEADNLEQFCRKIILLTKQISEELELEIKVGCSIGISCYPDDSTEISGLLKSADEAMYRSKQSGKNRFSYFSDSG